MFFRNKEIDEKNEIIQKLEKEKAEISEALNKSKIKNEVYEKEILDLKQKIIETNNQLLNERRQLEIEIMTSEKVAQDLEQQTNQMKCMETEYRKECDRLRQEIAKFEKMSKDDYFNYGIEHFSLETLSILYEKIKLSSFEALKAKQKKLMLMQNLIDILTNVLSSIQADYKVLNLFQLLGEGDTVEKMVENLNEVTVKDILKLKSFLRKNCSRESTMKENYEVLDCKTPEEYEEKLAIKKFLNILNQIANNV